MAPMTKRYDGVFFEEQLKDLQVAVKAHLPPGVRLTIAGLPQGRREIVGMLRECREVFAIRAELKESADPRAAEWLADAVAARLLVKSVKVALIHFVATGEVEGCGDIAGCYPGKTPEERFLAVARRQLTRDFRTSRSECIQPRSASRSEPLSETKGRS